MCDFQQIQRTIRVSITDQLISVRTNLPIFLIYIQEYSKFYVLKILHKILFLISVNLYHKHMLVTQCMFFNSSLFQVLPGKLMSNFSSISSQKQLQLFLIIHITHNQYKIKNFNQLCIYNHKNTQKDCKIGSKLILKYI